ncbi:hypothetical protein BGW42_006611 [Actinomortierella wolfii]|nr:hypothetical protein BGW42_006611 [Actinomortierella wolfii]
MKTATIAAATLALASVATADVLAINNPTQGSVWKAGETYFIGWTGNCAFMGNNSRSVLVDLMTGPSNTLRYVASLEPLDCSSSTVVRANVTVPANVATGNYSIRIQTEPPSYSNVFSIVNPNDKPTPTGGNTTPPPVQSQKPDGAGSMLEPKMLLALAGTAAAAAFQFLF